MPKDPICGMEVDPKIASRNKLLAYKDGATYYFCSEKCKQQFQGKKDWKSYIDLGLSAVLILTALAVIRAGYMLPFMGVAFLLLAVLKLIDIRGFAELFQQYDLIAARSRTYALVYPFIELGIGMALLFNYQIIIVAWIVAIAMSIGAIGVGKNVFGKSKVRCACLGAKIKVPLTRFTLTEDIVMAIMGIMILTGV